MSDASRPSPSRRDFLTASAALAAAGLMAMPAAAIEPFARPQPGPMKLSLSAYSFRDELTGKRGDGMTLFDLVDFCRERNVPGVELTSYYFPDGFDEPYLRRLARHCHTQGVSISGGAIRNDFCVPDEKQPAELDAVKRWIDAYAVLGAPVIRIFAGKVPKGDSVEAATQRCIRGTQAACDYAATKGVMLALENHGGITATPDSMLPIVRGVQSPAFGVNFDSGNFRTDAPYDDLAKIAPYAINAQIKVAMGPREAEYETDLPRVVQILREAGYAGWVALEYEEGGDTVAQVKRYLEALRPLLA